MTDTTVVPLVTLTRPATPVDEDLIEGLEALLALAREGDIQGIAYVTIASHGIGQYEKMGTGWRGLGVDNNCHIMLGGVAVLQARLIAEKGMTD